MADDLFGGMEKKISSILDRLDKACSYLESVSKKVYTQTSNRAADADKNGGEDGVFTSDSYFTWKGDQRKEVHKLRVSESGAKKDFEWALEKGILKRGPAKSGFGGLSPDQVWAATGWNLTPKGFVWGRTASTSLKEHFEKQVIGYRATYNPIMSNDELGPLFEGASQNYPIVTAEDALKMRREDARTRERARFDRMMRQEKSVSSGDDGQYAFGADTGVHDDFAYLREEEREQNERSARRRAIRRSRRAAVMREGLDDYQRFIHDNKGKYGREGAEQVFRQRLLKELPPFFKNSKMSTQQLINISKMMKAAGRIPFVGKMMHPAALAVAAWGASVAAGEKVDSANKAVSSWYATEMISGKPSESFKQAMYSVGVTDYSKILSSWQSLSTKYFDPSLVIPQFGRMLAETKDPRQRNLIARTIGLPDDVAAAMMMAYNPNMEDVPKAVKISSKRQQLEELQKRLLSSDSSLWEQIQGHMMSIWGEKWLEARGSSYFGMFFNPAGKLTEKLYPKSDEKGLYWAEDIIRNATETEEASESLKETESSGSGGDTTNTTNNSHAVYIGTLNLSADDPQTLIEQLYQMSGGNAYGENRAILASMGSGVIS